MSALEYLHSRKPGLIHGDIKGVNAYSHLHAPILISVQANILIDEAGSVKLADFGLITVTATYLASTTMYGKPYAGTVRYMAPELHRSEDETPTQKSTRTDTFALAMTAVEVRGSMIGEDTLSIAALDYHSQSAISEAPP